MFFQGKVAAPRWRCRVEPAALALRFGSAWLRLRGRQELPPQGMDEGSDQPTG